MLDSKTLKPVKRLIKAAIGRQSKLDKYLATSNKKASELIEKFEKNNNTKLLPQHKKMADDYATRVFGDKRYAPWLYVYTLIRGDFIEGWIPESYFALYVAPMKGLALVSVYKSFSNIVFKTDLIPDLAYHINGNFFDRNYSPITFSNMLSIIADKNSNVFVKRDSSNQGKEIYKLQVDRLNEEIFHQIGNCVIQTPIKQHLFLDEMIQGSVACIRIQTVRNLEGKIEFRASCLNLGREDDEWTRGGKSVLVPILNRNGELDSIGYTGDWTRCQSHPDTGYIFSGKRVPFFNSAVETCMNLHSLVPHFPIIAWDVSIGDDNQVKIMEWNAVYPGIKFHEGTVGPCYLGLGWENLWKQDINNLHISHPPFLII